MTQINRHFITTVILLISCKKTLEALNNLFTTKILEEGREEREWLSMVLIPAVSAVRAFLQRQLCRELPLQMLTVNELSPQRVRSLLLPKPKKKVDERQLRLDF